MNKYRFLSIFLILVCSFSLDASTKRSIQQAFTQRTDRAPHIDGVLEPEIWGMAEVIEDFVQFDPVYSGQPSQNLQSHRWSARTRNMGYGRSD